MYCPRCGLHNEDSDRFCSSCGQKLTTYRQLWTDAAERRPAPPTEPSARVPSYLGWAAAILTCCWPAWPAGVAALVFASRTESHLAAGNLAEAQEYSRKAKMWCLVTLMAGLVLWVVIFGVLFSIS